MCVSDEAYSSVKCILRCLQEVHLDKHIKLLDCPGIVMATSTSDAAMILRNCVKIEQLVDPLPPVEAILRRCTKAQVRCDVIIRDSSQCEANLLKVICPLMCRSWNITKFQTFTLLWSSCRYSQGVKANSEKEDFPTLTKQQRAC